MKFEAITAQGKCWHTAAEIAELALAGLPRTKRKVNERAMAEGWALRTGPGGEPLARPRQMRGGGFEYHVDVLPAAARAALAARSRQDNIVEIADAPTGRSAQIWRWYEGTNARTKAEAARRLEAVQLVDRLAEAGLTRSAAVSTAAAQSGIGASTLWGWLELIVGIATADRLAYLAPRRGGGGAEAEVDPGAWQFLLSDYLRPEKPTFTSCYWRMVKGFAEPRGITVPVERTLRRKLEREVDVRLITMKREGAEALRRKLPAQQRSVADFHALEAVNIDGHKFDVFVRWPCGKIGRPMMVAIQDIFSRKMLSWRIDQSENALATRLVFADLFRDWGIPKHCVLDNGRAFASKMITGGAKSRFRFKIRDEEPTGVLTALDIEIHFARPYRGQSKPIERGFRDLCDTIAKHPALAGAYTGNKPDAKPENYGSRAVEIDEFRAIVAAGMKAHNAKPGRRTETSQGLRSFDDTFDASYAIAPICRATPEQLRLALLTAEDRSSERGTGIVTLEGNRYWTDELGAHAGQKLTIRFDPDNLHSEIHVYDRQGRFIATAPVIDRAGFFDKTAANRRRQLERDLRQSVRAIEQAHDLLDAAQLAAMMPDHLDEAPARAPTVVRPARHRGMTAAALKPVSAIAETAPVTPVIDRIAAAVGRLRIVD